MIGNRPARFLSDSTNLHRGLVLVLADLLELLAALERLSQPLGSRKASYTAGIA
jgi:hypothetical protein